MQITMPNTIFTHFRFNRAAGLKKVFLSLVSLLLLASCASSNNTLTLNPQIVLPAPDPSLRGITISVNGADQRQDQALAKVNRDGQLITLLPSRDMRFLLQEVLERQMSARGYMIGANGSVDLQIVLNNLYADVQEGNLRYNITTRADVSIIAQTKNGSKQAKTYRSTYSIQGAFTATNDKIANAVNSVLNSVISDMAQDVTISNFIKQNAN